MSTPRVFFRLFVAFVVASAAAGCFGWLVLGPRAFIGGPIVVAALSIVASLRLESSLARRYHTEPRLPPGLAHTYRRALLSLPGDGPARPPRLMLAITASPFVFAVRSIGGDGSIFLSHGLISLLDENELRTVLARAVQRCQTPGTVLRSFCGWIVLQISRFSPRACKEIYFDQELAGWMRPFSALGFLMTLPLGQYFLPMSRVRLDGDEFEAGPEFGNAMRKIRGGDRIWRLSRSPVEFPFL